MSTLKILSVPNITTESTQCLTDDCINSAECGAELLVNKTMDGNHKYYLK